jgi:signal transduction histidine kinase
VSLSIGVEGLGLELVVASSLGQVLAPLRDLTLLYWIIVLTLGASTALAFSILISRYTQSLSRLAQAAQEIGLGELDPWLPLPSPGELGQLTQAFSHMLERIRRMMDQVSQSGRLAVIGQLSAYLAHEIRNPLSSIKLNQQRILRWIEAGRLPEYCRGPTEISLREVERLNASVTGVLQLSRASDVPREVVQLRPLLEEVVDLLHSRFRRKGVEIVLEPDPLADRILARPGQIKSVALNLMVNALDAQPDGGRLMILSSLCRDPNDGGPAVSILFQDDGPGIPGAIRNRIFEPFFTTKPGGAGIGLAMAKQAVEENGGRIDLLDTLSEGSGAAFVVVFPLAPLEAPKIPQRAVADIRSLKPGHARSKDYPEVARHPDALFTPDGLEAALESRGGNLEEDH